jgi:hypothetical protein
MNSNPTTPEPLNLNDLVEAEAKQQEQEEPTKTLTEKEKRLEYLRQWRQQHKEHVKLYNKKYHQKHRDDYNDMYSVVRELRCVRVSQDKLEDQYKQLITDNMHLINKFDRLYELLEANINQSKELKVELEPKDFHPPQNHFQTISSSQKSIPEIPEIKNSIFMTDDRTPTQSPIPKIPEIKKIKKIRKVKVKQAPPPSPTQSVTSVESAYTPTKITKTLVDDVLDELIDSDGNVIMSDYD